VERGNGDHIERAYDFCDVFAVADEGELILKPEVCDDLHQRPGGATPAMRQLMRRWCSSRRMRVASASTWTPLAKRMTVIMPMRGVPAGQEVGEGSLSGQRGRIAPDRPP